MSVNLPASMRKIMGLWPHVSTKGHTFFAGGNGGDRLYLVYNSTAAEGEAPWTLCTEDNDDAEDWTISRLFPEGGGEEVSH